jgi:hypothetical protein
MLLKQLGPSYGPTVIYLGRPLDTVDTAIACAIGIADSK